MRKWLTAQKTYEGFPLFLRRPATVDKSSLRPRLPDLAIITHTFLKRLPNGLPDPDYNETLVHLDSELLTALDIDQMGVPVLVETFGGKRHYYFYVAADVDLDAAMSPIVRRHPEEKLSWAVRSDPQWDFLEKYSREHF